MHTASKKDNLSQQLLSIGEASEYLGISIDTLRRRGKKEKLTTYRSPGGHRYFQKTDLDKLFGTKYERNEEVHPRKLKETTTEQLPPETQTSTEALIKSEITTAQQYQTLDREPREIKIPHVIPVKIIKEEARNYATYENFQTSLTSSNPISNSINQGILNPPIQMQQTQKARVEDNKSVFLTANQAALIIIIVTILILFATVIFIISRSTPNQLLSPLG